MYTNVILLFFNFIDYLYLMSVNNTFLLQSLTKKTSIKFCYLIGEYASFFYNPSLLKLLFILKEGPLHRHKNHCDTFRRHCINEFSCKHLIKRGLLGKHVPQPKSTTPGVSKRNPFMCPNALRPYYLATESHTLSAIIKDAEKYLHWWHYSALG